MKPNDTIAIIVTALLLSIFIAFYVFLRRLRDAYDDNDNDSDGSSLSYISPPSGGSEIDAADVLPPRPPPSVHVLPRGEPRGPEV